MIKIIKPQLEQKKIVEDCISNMRSGVMKKRIEDSVKEIVDGSSVYNQKAENAELSNSEPHCVLKSGATKEDMKKLYEEKFVPKKSGGRKYYDAIMLLAKNNRCPYCGQREVSTLDHYLPKSEYPLYAVTPYNLIPSCKDCNFGKLDMTYNGRKEEIIHPYYDDFSDKKWIIAKMIEEEPIAFTFEVQCPDEWDTIKKKRAQNHFEYFKLNDLYKPYAAEEYISCFNRILRLYKKGGIKLAIEDLKEHIEDRDMVRLNTWQSAMYQAIIDSKWFWEEYMPKQC